MQARWSIAAICVVGLLAAFADGRGGFGWGPHGIGSGINDGRGVNGNGQNPPAPLTLENAVGEAVWTGGSAGGGDADPAYKPLSKDDAAKAISAEQDAAKAIDDKYHMNFKDTSSAHALIYSTAQGSAVDGLASKVESAFTTASRVFASQPKQLVLPGKILVYVFDKRSSYESFAKSVDNFDVPKGAIGYAFLPDPSSPAGNPAAAGDAAAGAAATPGPLLHIVMGPPPDDLIDHNVKPISAWQAALVRTMTFVLMNRFHSAQAVPTWVMQGLADATADTVLPQPANRTRAYLFSQAKDSNVVDVLNEKRQDFADHPLMQTLTETLLARDRQAYLKFVLALKDGKSSSDALQASYKWSFDQLGDAWNTYVKHFAPNAS